ncbi:hypothetical protein [Stenotrophomonas rhizophila]
MYPIYGPSFQEQAREFRMWTLDALPGLGRGTEAWQAYHERRKAIRDRPRTGQGSTKLIRNLHEQHELGWLAQDSENAAARRRAR